MLAILLLCSIGLTIAKTNTNYFNLPEENWTKPETPEVGFLGLPSGASLVVPNIQVQFSCVGKSYGYYADVANNCQIFHICQPSTTATGEPVIYHFTKFCPNSTQFDQRLLNCQSLNFPNLLPCQQSVQYYPHTEARFGGQFEGQQRETVVEQTPEVQSVEQTVEQTQFEEVPVVPVRANPVPAPVKGLQLLQTPVAVNVQQPTKNVARSESVQVVQQSNIPVAQSVVAQNGFSAQSTLPIRSGQIVQSQVSQVVPSQPVVQSIVPFNSVPEVVVSQQVAPIVPARNVPVSAPTPAVTQPGLAGPVASLSSRFIQTTQNQPVVTLRSSSVIQPTLNQQTTFFRSVPQPSVTVNQVPTPIVPQPIIPFRSTQIVENISNQGVVSQPLLSRYNVLPSQLVGVQSPQVVPQVYRTQSVVSQYSTPSISATPVVAQNLVPQPAISQAVPQYSVQLNGVFSSPNTVPQLFQPFVPAVPNLLRYNGPYVNVVRPAQNPEYIN